MARAGDGPPQRASRGAGVLQNLLVLLLPYGCGSIASATPAEEAAPIDVQTLVAESRSVPRTLRLTGTLLASREAHVAADGAGKIAGTFVERGDTVREGEPLVRLDARARALETEEALPAATALGDAVLRAPFSGIVAELGVGLGEDVVPGTRVATLVELATLRLELSVPEPVLAAARTDGALVLTVAAYPERRFSARVRHVGPLVRRAGRDPIVEAMVDNTDGLLRPGMLAVAELTVGMAPLEIEAVQ